MITHNAKVCLRADYHDPLNHNPKEWDIVSQENGYTTITSLGVDEMRVKTDGLRWADDEKHEGYLQALYKGHLKKAARILNQDPLIDVKGTRGKPSLYWALYISQHQDPEVIEKKIDWLTKRGVPIDQRTHEAPYEGWSMLAHVIHEGNIRAAEKLVERGASFQDATPIDCYDLLTLAASTHSFNMMAWLLDKGFEPLPNFPHLDLLENNDDDWGYSTASTHQGTLPILHQAAQDKYETEDLARVMFEHIIQECDISRLDQTGKTAVETARPENIAVLSAVLSDYEARHLHEDTTTPTHQTRQGLRL